MEKASVCTSELSSLGWKQLKILDLCIGCCSWRKLVATRCRRMEPEELSCECAPTHLAP